VKVAGRWRYVYRAVDQYRQVIDVFVSARRDTRAGATVLGHGPACSRRADRGGHRRSLDAAAFHNTAQYASNRIEADHSWLKARLRPMRGLKRDHTARVIVRGHAFMQNLRRGHYELGVEARTHRRVAVAFTELARTI
jgi:IS6 family transposase